MLRYLTAGESHGQGLVVIVEGLPAGLAVTVDDIQAELARRRLGYGRGPRMRFEQDELKLIGGIRHGRTLGSPVAIEIGNSEWVRSDKWHEEMSPAPGATKAPLTQPRPGHADLTGMQKYGFDDARRAGARQCPRDRRSGGGGHAGQAAAGHHRHRGHQPRDPDGRGPLEGRPAAPADLERVDAARCGASTAPPRRR